jgi:uncharacterized membrane protein YkoI
VNHRNGVQGKALLLAGGLTAFTLVLVLAVAGRVASRLAEQPAPPTAVARATAPPATGSDPAVQALIDQREAAYRQVIQEANDRLVQANRRLAQVQAPARPAAPPAQAPQPAAIGADVAGQIALLVAPGAALTATPELVNFQGTAAYEVVLSAGKVYVDAHTGQVLYDGVAAQVAQGGGGGDGNGGGGQGGDAHEAREHEGGDEGGDEQDG